MRLPRDAALLVIEGADAAPVAGDAAALLAVWREEDLPRFLIRARPDASGVDEPDDRALAASAPDAFDGTGLEAALDSLGATTLVVCGALPSAVATAREAVAKGFRVFLVGDACWPAARGDALASADGKVVDAAAARDAGRRARLRERLKRQGGA